MKVYSYMEFNHDKRADVLKMLSKVIRDNVKTQNSIAELMELTGKSRAMVRNVIKDATGGVHLYRNSFPTSSRRLNTTVEILNAMGMTLTINIDEESHVYQGDPSIYEAMARRCVTEKKLSLQEYSKRTKLHKCTRNTIRGGRSLDAHMGVFTYLAVIQGYGHKVSIQVN